MAFDAFIDLYDSAGTHLDGESLDKNHKKMLQLKGFKFGNEHPVEMGIGQGFASGKSKFVELTIDINQSIASPTLFVWSCSGEHLKKAVIYVRKNTGKDPKDYMIITMHGVFVTKMETTAADGADAMVESVSFAYEAFQYEYHMQKENGDIESKAYKAGWDQKQNSTFTA